MPERHLGKFVDEPENASPKGLNYLLALAVDDYVHCEKLNNAVKDAKDFVTVLTDRYGFETTNTTTLYNEEVTLANIYSEMKSLRAKVSDDDNLVIYFSGHGYYDKESKNGYLVPAVATENEVWNFLPNSEMLTQIKSINSFHTLLIVDSCFSGSLIVKKNVAGAGALATNVERFPSRWGLAAGSIEEVEDGFTGENSPFAKALLSYLRTNKQPKIPISEIAQHVRRVTPHNAKQTPICGVLFKVGSEGGEFVFNLNEVSEKASWEEAKTKNTKESIQYFLEKFPNGEYAQQAKSSLQTLKEDALWKRALAIQKIYAYDDYLEAFPRGKYVNEAVTEIRKLEEENAWKNALQSHSISGYRTYLIKYPESRHSETAKANIEKIKGPVPRPPDEEGPETEILLEYEMVLVGQGKFIMGKNSIGSIVLQHEVKIDAFKMGKYPVTFEQYDVFCKSENRPLPSDENWGRGSRPVINITWFDAIDFCNWMSDQEGLEKVYKSDNKEVDINWSANGYRLPTEAEWEYAARGGENTSDYFFAGGNDLADLAWAQSEDQKRIVHSTQKVGAKTPNELGLYDLNGNVWEWCTDGLRRYMAESEENPIGHLVSSIEPAVVRGGAWDSIPDFCLLEKRGRNVPDYKANNYGFRCVKKI